MNRKEIITSELQPLLVSLMDDGVSFKDSDLLSVVFNAAQYYLEDNTICGIEDVYKQLSCKASDFTSCESDEKNLVLIRDILYRILKGDEKKDAINPDHYKNGKYECIDVMEEVTKDLTGLEAVCTGNVLKYIWRWKNKNGLEDLKKAQWYLNRLINTIEIKYKETTYDCSTLGDQKQIIFVDKSN